MADDLKQTGGFPPRSKNSGYWSEKFDVSREELRKAVQAAGPMVNGKRCKVYVDGRIIGDEPIPDSLFRAVDVILAELPDPAEPS